MEISKWEFDRIVNRVRGDATDFFCGRRFTLPPELSRAKKLSEAITHIKQRWPAEEPENDIEQPVFLFSAGWRSGSTLLQRLIFSSRQVVVWGEPLGDSAFIARLGHSLTCITDNWPDNSFFGTDVRGWEFSNKWIANLTPEIRFLRAAHRAFFIEWFKTPVQEKFGVERWGMKEVRLTIDHARYLKWLFPQARFVFICRDPRHAFRSWRGNRWRSVWPGYYPQSALAFSRHWRLLMEGFVSHAADVDGMLIRFEDLVAGKVDLQRLAGHIGVSSLDGTVLQRKINSPGNIVKKNDISLLDRAVIASVCGSLMRRAGYND
jgi:hypothetical protein